MAYIPTECTLKQYEEQIYSGDSLHRLYIKHGNTVIGTEEEDYASPYASSLTWKRKILKNGSKSFSLNNFISQEIELVLYNYQITNLSDEIEIKLGTYIESVKKWVYIPLGIYLIQDLPTTDKNKTTYKLRDKSVKFDFNYNAKPLIDNSEHVDSEGNKYVTKLEIVQDICSKAGVTYNGSTTFIGYDDHIGIYDNTITGRVYIAHLSEQASCIATIDRTGNLMFINMSNLTKRTINEDIIEKFEKGDNYKISKAIYESGTIHFEKGTDDNDTLFINSANPYIANQEQLDRIYNNIVGFEANSLTTGKILGNPTIDPWDLITFTYENKTYKSLAQYTLKFNGVLISTYGTTIEYEAKQTNTTKNSEATYRKGVRQEIDNTNASVSTIVENVEDVQEDINGENGLLQRVSAVETKQTATDLTINVISRNIDTTTGEIREVTTSNGYKFSSDGLNIYTDKESYNALINNKGTYYKDGEKILSQTTKDGTITKDMILYGKYYYGVDEDLEVANFKKEDAMFIAQKYVDENGVECFGHFNNQGE